MPINRIKEDIRRHRPIDWFAIAVLISFAFIVAGVLANNIDEFNRDIDAQVEGIMKGF